MKNIKTLNDIIKNSNYIVFFGGAGVSTESGIPDFRSKDGLYNQKYSYPPEEILSRSFFNRHTEEFYKFYFDKLVITDIKPNITHIKLVELEKANKLKAVITQNIDGLHEMAGSKNVLNLHGSIYDNYCMDCHKYFKLEDLKTTGVPRCQCGGIIKPDVVLYEEALKDEIVDEAIEHITKCDTLIVCGTSLNVYPAAGLLRYFKGKHLVVINKDNLDNIKADLVINDYAGNVFKMIEI